MAPGCLVCKRESVSSVPQPPCKEGQGCTRCTPGVERRGDRRFTELSHQAAQQLQLR